MLIFFQPEMVEKLIVVDITQFNLKHKPDVVVQMMTTLKDLKFDKNVSLEEARRKAAETVSKIGVNEETSEFFLRNLQKNAENEFRWCLNLESLAKNLLNILLYPQESLRDAKYMGETLYIGGANSRYIPKDSLERIKANFPKAEMRHIENAGHEVYADQTEEFVEIVSKFLNSK